MLIVINLISIRVVKLPKSLVTEEMMMMIDVRKKIIDNVMTLSVIFYQIVNHLVVNSGNEKFKPFILMHVFPI